MRYFDRALTKSYIVNATLEMPGVLALSESLSDAQVAPHGRPSLRVVWDTDLDWNRNWLGAKNGVLDLDTGRLYQYEAAAECLVTSSLRIDWDPDAWHEDADAIWNPVMLTESDMDLVRYVQQAMAWGLKGKPAQTMNLLTDAAGAGGEAGKTTFLSACVLTLGDYGATLEMDALKGLRGSDSAGKASPFLRVLAYARVAYIEESNQAKISEERFKALTGGGKVVFRMLYGNPMERYVVCSIWAASNAPLRLDLSGGAESRRYRPIPMPKIPPERQRSALASAFQDGTPDYVRRRQALLRLMVETCWGLVEPPEPPQAFWTWQMRIGRIMRGRSGMAGQSYRCGPGAASVHARGVVALRAMDPAASEELRQQSALTDRLQKRFNLGSPKP